jgi:DNA-binding response OmpR family regulator
MGESPKILVVDDETQICKSVEKILAKSNYQVTLASSAQEALEKLAKESYSLLISDIVMPGRNGLELLKMVKKEWPLTKAVMMTAFASTDTAMKSIRLGALDYIPKPFTPKELRTTVDNALSGRLVEVAAPAKERELIDVIDIDSPFEAKEVIEQVGEDYAKMLGRSDMPVVEVKIQQPAEHFCGVGAMVCDIFKKLGATCKAGTKSGECPQKKAKKTKPVQAVQDRSKLVGIDEPFTYDEVISITGPEYVLHLQPDGYSFMPYEELKRSVSQLSEKYSKRIDVDMPFPRDEVAQQTGDVYADHLTRSDRPVVEVVVSESLENYCQVGHMVCDIFKKLGATCKAGTKSNECPQLRARKAKGAAAPTAVDTRRWIGVDQPFDYAEVAAVAGADYVRHLHQEGLAITPYEELKRNMAAVLGRPAEVQAPAKAAAPKAAVHVLVVDDEVAVNNNIRKILAKQGHRVDQAASKEEAIEKIASGSKYGVVLLDLRIPGVQGLELLAAVRDKQPQARVVIVTGYASVDTAVQAARMGAVHYLAKPFTPAEIRSATENALRMAA